MADVKRLVAIAAGVLGIGVIGYAVFSEPSDEEQIRELLERLETAVVVDGRENLLIRKARIDGEFDEIFDADVRVSIPELTSLKDGRSGLSMVATQAGSYFQTASVDIDDLELEVGSIGANVNARASLVATRSGGPERDDRQVRFELSKSSGDWLITAVEVTPRWEEDEPEE